ncbi:MAG TPA: hypothetical protein PK289_00075 [Bacteroidia bacterium]|nr:hypothetical protein [Bacteroidia bacterium]
MKTIDLNKPGLGLDDQVLLDNGTPVNLGKTLGGFLVASTKGDALKYYDWACALYKGNSIKVDSSDFKKIRDFVENHEHITNLAKAQILKELDSIKED